MGDGKSFEIHTLTPDEWQRCREIRLAGMLDAPYAFGSTHEGELAQEDSWWQQRVADFHWVVANDGQADVSLAMLAIQRLPESTEFVEGLDLDRDTDYPWIRSVWTHPDARGRRLVDALCLHLCEVAKSRGYETMVLGVRAENERAFKAYQRMGFNLAGRFFPTHFGPEQPNYLMSKSLD